MFQVHKMCAFQNHRQAKLFERKKRELISITTIKMFSLCLHLVIVKSKASLKVTIGKQKKMHKLLLFRSTRKTQ